MPSGTEYAFIKAEKLTLPFPFFVANEPLNYRAW
jgi:hypothetical protein